MTTAPRVAAGACLLLALGGGCAREMAATTPAGAPPRAAPASTFEPAPRYAATFEAHDEGCRGPLDDHHGSVTLSIEDAHATALELTLQSRDILGGIELLGPDGKAIEPAGPIVCRFEGVGRPEPGSYAVTLTADDGPGGAHCGQPESFELRCRPASLDLADEAGVVAPTDVLRCEIGGARPPVLGVLGEDELVFATTPIHSQLLRPTMGLVRHELTRGGPPGAPP